MKILDQNSQDHCTGMVIISEVYLAEMHKSPIWDKVGIKKYGYLLNNVDNLYLSYSVGELFAAEKSSKIPTRKIINFNRTVQFRKKLKLHRDNLDILVKEVKFNLSAHENFLAQTYFNEDKKELMVKAMALFPILNNDVYNHYKNTKTLSDIGIQAILATSVRILNVKVGAFGGINGMNMMREKYYIFRLILIEMINAFIFKCEGGLENMKPEKVVNEANDYTLVVNSTYCSGLITKESRMHHKRALILKCLERIDSI